MRRCFPKRDDRFFSLGKKTGIMWGDMWRTCRSRIRMRVRTCSCVSGSRSSCQFLTCHYRDLRTYPNLPRNIIAKHVMTPSASFFLLTFLAGHSYIDSGQSLDGYPSICKLKAVYSQSTSGIPGTCLLCLHETSPLLPSIAYMSI